MKWMILPLVFFLFLIVQSCKKTSDFNNNPAAGIAYVSVVHAAPKTGSLDFSFDKNRIPLNFFNYTDRVGYLNTFQGPRKFYVYPKGSSDTLITKSITITEQKNYTIFIADTGSKMDAVLIRDSSRAPGSDSVRIRLVNMSPDAGSLDLYLENANTPVITGIPYKTAADFVSLKAANNIMLEVRASGTTATLARSALRMNLVSGNYYTVWTTGFRSMTNENGKLRVETFIHGYSD